MSTEARPGSLAAGTLLTRPASAAVMKGGAGYARVAENGLFSLVFRSMRIVGMALKNAKLSHARQTHPKCLILKGLRGGRFPRLASRGPIEAILTGEMRSRTACFRGSRAAAPLKRTRGERFRRHIDVSAAREPRPH